jgi:hypothetical protein
MPAVGSFYLPDPAGQRQPPENYHRDFVDCAQVASGCMEHVHARFARTLNQVSCTGGSIWHVLHHISQRWNYQAVGSDLLAADEDDTLGANVGASNDHASFLG